MAAVATRVNQIEQIRRGLERVRTRPCNRATEEFFASDDDLSVRLQRLCQRLDDMVRVCVCVCERERTECMRPGWRVWIVL